ncbi:hypothetical protein BDN72DRAFT_834370 [Pluteus cervinus]|uniref:Uncharacterized protein n=1 Tax=Pluteus cervinus TaxID=181527 RepID=A0ACD3B7D5_9AGAR|nr:hypothetical protein BDN72DRAFT_834370 [Pluteus cervinus]
MDESPSCAADCPHIWAALTLASLANERMPAFPSSEARPLVGWSSRVNVGELPRRPKRSTNDQRAQKLAQGIAWVSKFNVGQKYCVACAVEVPDPEVKYSQRNIPEIVIRLAQHPFRGDSTVRSLQDLLDKTVNFVHDDQRRDNRDQIRPLLERRIARFVEAVLLPQIIAMNQRRLYSYVNHRVAVFGRVLNETYFTIFSPVRQKRLRAVMRLLVDIAREETPLEMKNTLLQSCIKECHGMMQVKVDIESMEDIWQTLRGQQKYRRSSDLPRHKGSEEDDEESHIVDEFEQCLDTGPDNPAELLHCRVLPVLMTLARYYRAAETIADGILWLSTTYKHLTVRVEVVQDAPENAPRRASACNPPSTFRTYRRWIGAFRVPNEQELNTHWEKRVQSDVLYVHPEINLFMFYAQNPHLTPLRKIFGISTKTCLACNEFFHASVFVPSRDRLLLEYDSHGGRDSHHRPYTSWLFPSMSKQPVDDERLQHMLQMIHKEMHATWRSIVNFTCDCGFKTSEPYIYRSILPFSANTFR